MITFIIFLLSVFRINIADQNSDLCPLKPQIYHELQCIPVKVTGERCVTRYACPNFGAYNSSQCYYQDRYYNVGMKIPKELAPACKKGCYCDMPANKKSSTNRARFVCEKRKDCFTPPVRGCIYQKDIDQCCGGKKICGKEVEKLPSCTFEGKIFRYGETIYPHFPPCFKCACNKHFKNTTVESNEHCRRVNCNIAFENFDEIQSGCAPIFYGKEQCCPFKYRCPTDTDYIVPGPFAGKKQRCEKYSKCKYGNLSLKIGDSLNISRKCLKCSCVTPPLVTCHQSRTC